jgi:hypothetical protein
VLAGRRFMAPVSNNGHRQTPSCDAGHVIEWSVLFGIRYYFTGLHYTSTAYVEVVDLSGTRLGRTFGPFAYSRLIQQRRDR